jgi:HAD superfamily hydrolase (TIGR01509 family)
LLRRFGTEELGRYFDVAVASAEIGYAKPEAQAYEITADKLGVELTECVFTDDRGEYCEGARGLGMQAILYENLEQFKAELAKIVAS